MQAGAGSEEGAAGSPPLQKGFGSLVAKNNIVCNLFKVIHSTVTDFARFFGISTFLPKFCAK